MIESSHQRPIPRALRASLALAISLLPFVVSAQGADESNLKAAFIYNFLKFAELPSASQSRGRFQLCFAGDSHAEALRGLTGKLVHGTAVDVIRVLRSAEVESCSAIFFGADSSLRAAGRSFGVLTIGERPGFLDEGGIINFYNDGDRVRFEISPANAKKAGLSLSSQLLKLSRIVEPKP